MHSDSEAFQTFQPRPLGAQPYVNTGERAQREVPMFTKSTGTHAPRVVSSSHNQSR